MSAEEALREVGLTALAMQALARGLEHAARITDPDLRLRAIRNSHDEARAILSDNTESDSLRS